ncbi:MAG: type II secretion system protein M [Pseudomonadota bacterium]
MKEWFQGLSDREKRIVLAGAVALAIMLFYMVLWAPLSSSVAELRKSVESESKNLAWMKAAAQEIKGKNRGGSVPGVQRGDESLMTLIDRTAKQGTLGAALKRVQPDKDGVVRVWLEDAPFDDVVFWLGGLKNAYGITVENAVIERSERPGYVKARLGFTEGGA